MTNVERGEEIPTAQPKAHSINVGRNFGLRFLRWVFLRHRWQRIRNASGFRNAGTAEIHVGNISWIGNAYVFLSNLATSLTVIFAAANVILELLHLGDLPEGREAVLRCPLTMHIHCV